MSDIVRTRIAPSPTGNLHIGHLRTSLYDYAWAKKNGGKFVLRIEDTDRNRYVEGAVDKILDLHEYVGLMWDEGPRVGGPQAPYIQSQRLPLYIKYAKELVDKGHAYYCFCTPERLEQLKESQRKEGVRATKYDKHCLHLSKDEVQAKLDAKTPYVIRLNVPSGETIVWHDEVYGDISVLSDELDDQVLIKSDGYPTYHMAVVVDDHLMCITHIIRGNDWLPSTPKHILLYRFFGWTPPKFIHLPNLKEKSGTRKLSKRYGAVSVEDFLREGYIPEALLNFLMLLGWHPTGDREIFSLDEFIKEFSLDRINKTDLVSVDREKLLWMNGYYIRNMSDIDLWKQLLKWSSTFKVFPDLIVQSHEKMFMQILPLVKDRMKLLSDIGDLTDYFFEVPSVDVDLLLKYSKEKSKATNILSNFISTLDTLSTDEWTVETLDKVCHDVLAKEAYKPREAFMTLRVALSGKKVTPPLFDVMHVLGKSEVLSRLASVKDSLI